MQPAKQRTMAAVEINLKAAINAISDVVQNRPRPLRDVDQIYMKTGDMVSQAEMVASWARDKRLAFIGDGDAISICTAYLHARGIIGYGPAEIVVFDFDERICGAISRFADREGLKNLRSQLYNCVEPFPSVGQFDLFYTNPPWGASNEGESVVVFAERGMEATAYTGEGLIVIADDIDLQWCQRVLRRTQQFGINEGYYVSKMMPRVHEYHLDDAPTLRSCNLFLKSISQVPRSVVSDMVRDGSRLRNFYGSANQPRHKYVRERKRVDYGRAGDDEYFFESWGDEHT